MSYVSELTHYGTVYLDGEFTVQELRDLISDLEKQPIPSPPKSALPRVPERNRPLPKGFQR